jgi:hypothetical protein
MPRTADPCKVGTLTEAIVLAALLERGFEVMIPFGNRAKYDFVIDDGQRLQRVQVKTAQGGTNHSALRFNTYSLSAAHRGRRRKCSYRGLIDLFAVYFPGNQAVYLVPAEKTPDCGECYLRLGPAKNGQLKRIRWAADFQIR